MGVRSVTGGLLMAYTGAADRFYLLTPGLEMSMSQYSKPTMVQGFGFCTIAVRRAQRSGLKGEGQYETSGTYKNTVPHTHLNAKHRASSVGTRQHR